MQSLVLQLFVTSPNDELFCTSKTVCSLNKNIYIVHDVDCISTRTFSILEAIFKDGKGIPPKLTFCKKLQGSLP